MGRTTPSTTERPNPRPPSILLCGAVLVAVSLLPAAGCGDASARASVDPPTRVEVQGLRAEILPSGGPVMHLEADSARLDPGFPDSLAGAFETAGLRLSQAEPPPDPDPSDGGAEADDLRVEARRMRYDGRGGHARFSGDVRAAYRGLTLRCDTLEVTYHRAERTADFVATGAVRVVHGDLEAGADRAEYGGREGRLTLTGSPRVSGGMGVLEGTRIVLVLGDETLTVEEVRGRFRLR